MNEIRHTSKVLAIIEETEKSFVKYDSLRKNKKLEFIVSGLSKLFVKFHIQNSK